MKRCFLLILLTIPTLALADPVGFYVGGGSAATANADCSSCDSSGVAVVAGFDFNRIFGIDAMLAQTDLENYNAEFSTVYAGVNAGFDFGSEWIKVYGKAGFFSGTQSEAGYSDVSETNSALGLGVRVTPWGNQSNVFLKLDAYSTSFMDEDVGASTLTVGYKF